LPYREPVDLWHRGDYARLWSWLQVLLAHDEETLLLSFRTYLKRSRIERKKWDKNDNLGE